MLFEINLRLFKREIYQQLVHFPGTRVPGNHAATGVIWTGYPLPAGTNESGSVQIFW